MLEKTGIRKLLNAAATTTAEQFSISEAVGHSRYHSLYLFWTPGATNNVLTVKIYSTPSDTAIPDSSKKWVQDQKWTLGSQIYTVENDALNNTAASTTEVPLRYDFTVNANAVRIGYSETVSAGVLTAFLCSRGQ